MRWPRLEGKRASEVNAHQRVAARSICDDPLPDGRREGRGHVPTALIDFLREQQAHDWANFRGTVVQGTVPVTEALLRELVGRRPPPRGARITGVHILPGTVLRVDLVVGTSLLSKRLSPEFRLSGVDGLPDHPTITAEVARAYGLVLSRVLRHQPASTYVAFDGQRLTIGLRELVERQWGGEVAALVSLVTRADLRSEAGTLFVDFEVAVP